MVEVDAELVALIDNELDEAAKSRVLMRLAEDEALRKRYEALLEAGKPIAASLDALIEKAPLARLRAALPPPAAARAASGRFGRIALRELAAGFVVGLLAAGAAAWVALSFAPTEEKNDWRAAVAEYTELFTNDTFAPMNPDAALTAKELSEVGAKVGVDLTPENLELPGLRFKVAFMLSFQGSPLGVVGYVDAEGAPVLFCVIANRAPDSPMRSERRGELSLATWSSSGRSHLVIGHMPEELAVDLARTLEKRV